MFLTESLRTQKIGRELVFSADLCYNDTGDVNGRTEQSQDHSVERRCVLSRIVGTGVLDGPQIELTTYGQIADKYINQLNDFYDDLSVESHVIMPNHIYAVGKRHR